MGGVKALRSVRVNRIAKKLARRHERRQSEWKLPPLRRKMRKPRASLLIAYDLETTSIRAGETPEPRYLTAFSDALCYSGRVFSFDTLAAALRSTFLTPELNKARFVAWNGNNFDVYLVALALLTDDAYVLRPYLTGGKNLRGLCVTCAAKDGKGRALSWEFLDGISMTGLTGWTLAKFLETFAPAFGKLKGPDFSREEFDAGNAAHVRYAERDSEGLYRGLMEASRIVGETFGETLRPTVGNLGVRIFQANMPDTITCWAPPYQLKTILREQVMRGGYCHRARKYKGPLWKYDLNQAYAAAMREAWLPAGRVLHSPGGIYRFAKAYIARVEATKRGGMVPFYYKDMEGKARFDAERIRETWLTSMEVKQLRAEGWRVKAHECYFWEESFKMTAFVDALEGLRREAAGGPSGAVGTMVKMIGNNSYGKTVEQLDGLELQMAARCPEGFSSYQAEGSELEYVWYKFGEPQAREYHQPQIGAFITAHVRMQVRRAILMDASAWLYADTDCVAFTRPVALPLSPWQYGLWKLEESGTEYYVIEKKVYASADGATLRAKGMNVRKLTLLDFKQWYEGKAPEQVQVQRQNFVKFMAGGAMFSERRKVGQVFKTVALA